MKKPVLILLVLVLVFPLSACGGQNKDETAESTYSYYKSEAETFEISTGYVPLYYPTKWKDNTEISLSEEGNGLRVSFTAVFGDERLPLFDFIFGKADDGYLLGTLDTENGVTELYLSDKTLGGDLPLTEKQKNTYYDMSEGVNDIISKLVYVSGLKIKE